MSNAQKKQKNIKDTNPTYKSSLKLPKFAGYSNNINITKKYKNKIKGQYGTNTELFRLLKIVKTVADCEDRCRLSIKLKTVKKVPGCQVTSDTVKKRTVGYSFSQTFYQ